MRVYIGLIREKYGRSTNHNSNTWHANSISQEIQEIEKMEQRRADGKDQRN